MPTATNSMLDLLSPADAAALKPHLKPMRFEHKRVLFEAGDRISAVYFPTTAIISMVVSLTSGETIEAAMIGKDGVVGASSALDSKLALSRAIVQLAGDGFTCDADAFKGAALQSSTLLSKVFRHEQTLYSQAQQSAACMAAHDVESRLCRWLLRARDLSGSDTLLFTQEFLAEMLGVRRTSVTLVAHALQHAGMIKYARGKIQILDIEGLREAACECYETINVHYDQLMKS